VFFADYAVFECFKAWGMSRSGWGEGRGWGGAVMGWKWVLGGGMSRNTRFEERTKKNLLVRYD
jgi:hypothetical protein